MRIQPLAIAAAIALSSVAAEAASNHNAGVSIRAGTLAGTVGTSGPATPVVQTGGVLAPLTAQECTKLGGSVITNSVCNSKNSCQRVDENGTVHEVCLSAK
jgi:hypothetical protein